jgi:hypothetical protein
MSGRPENRTSDFETLVQRIVQSDRRIRSWEAHVRTTIKGELSADLDWGYDRGMEYFSGVRYVKHPDPESLRPYRFHCTFDGERQFSLSDLGSSGNVEVHGAISGFQNISFDGTPNVTWLLGGRIRHSGRLRLGELLRDSANVQLRDGLEEANGERCNVLEIPEANPWVDDRGCEARLWISPQREYRLVRAEQYRIYGRTARLPVLTERLDVTDFRKVDGLWFPITGVVKIISHDLQPLPPFTEKDYEGLTEDQVYEKGLKVVEDSVTSYGIEVEPESIRINHEITRDKLAIDFPSGCKIDDGYSVAAYRAWQSQYAKPSKSPPRIFWQPSAVSFWCKPGNRDMQRDVAFATGTVPGMIIVRSSATDPRIGLTWTEDERMPVCHLALIGDFPPGNRLEKLKVEVAYGSEIKELEIPLCLMIQ